MIKCTYILGHSRIYVDGGQLYRKRFGWRNNKRIHTVLKTT